MADRLIEEIQIWDRVSYVNRNMLKNVNQMQKFYKITPILKMILIEIRDWEKMSK